MPDKTIQLARRQLSLDNRTARQLDVTEGCPRSWDRKGAPRYAILALMAGLIPQDRRDSFRFRMSRRRCNYRSRISGCHGQSRLTRACSRACAQKSAPSALDPG